VSDLPVRIYRIVALTIVAVLLVVLAFVLTSDKGHLPPSSTTTTTTTTTTAVDGSDDGAVSEAERTASGLVLSLNTLNRVARAACDAAASSATREEVRQKVLVQILSVRPGTSVGMAAVLTDAAAGMACASAYRQLPDRPSPDSALPWARLTSVERPQVGRE
jgi:type IV secretory pathway VirB2 component (pilin)